MALSALTSHRGKRWGVNIRGVVSAISIIFLLLPLQTEAGCPFQNPFWFLDRPTVVTVVDSQGKMVPDRVRVSWGRLENFKCVDYFQIEYYEKDDRAGTVKMSDRINRHRSSHDIDIKPCIDYLFKVIASEDWNGMREDFKMASDVITFRVDYAPRFKKPPKVIERKIRVPKARPGGPRRNRQRRSATEPTIFGENGQVWNKEDQIWEGGDLEVESTTPTYSKVDEGRSSNFTSKNTQLMQGGDRAWGGREKRAALFEEMGQVPTSPPPPTEPVPYNVLVQWKLKDLDWPTCLDYFEFDYYDIVYNESTYMKTFSRPFPAFHHIMEFELRSDKIPCSEEYAFITRVFGKTGDFSLSSWTPPSCILTTPEPTTTTPAPSTTLQEEGALEEAQNENEKLKEKISGLKQQYGPIGKQVYEAMKEQVFYGIEAYMARKKVLEGGDIGQLEILAKDPDYFNPDPFQV